MPHRQFNQEDETIVVIKVILVKSFYEANKNFFSVSYHLMYQSK